MVSHPIPMAKINDVQDVVLSYLDIVYDRAHGLSPDEIMSMLYEGKATLHMCGEEGFYIAQWDDVACHVMSAVAFHGSTPLLNDIISAATDFARQMGKTKLTFASPRLGWLKTATSAGFRVTSIEYEVEL